LQALPEQNAQAEAGRAGIAPGVALEARVAACSDLGRVRSNNEDRVLVFDLKRQRELSAVKTEIVQLRPRGVLLVVADGMGGMASGETASQMTVENFLTAFIERIPDAPRGSNAPTFENPGQVLVDSVKETNARVFARASAERGLKGMGTTLTAAFLEADKLVIAQVGDSRCYMLRDGALKQLTRDQTLLASLAEKGPLPPGNFKFKNMLLQAVGSQQDVQVALTEVPVRAGDRVLVCSDGLHGPVPDERIAELLTGEKEPEELAQSLAQQANENGGPDNVSVIVCDIRPGAGL
jgi:protein phosphatase